MSDALSFAEVDGQHVELLPARTVLGVLDVLAGGQGLGGDDGTQNNEQVRQGDGDGSVNNADGGGGAATGGATDTLNGLLG